MTLRTETILANNTHKRKSVSEHEYQGQAKRVFKDASEFFDQVSNAAIEPASEDVLVDKEVFKTKPTHTVKKEIEDVDVVIKTEISGSIGEGTGAILDNLLIDNLLLSDEDDDREDSSYDKFLADFLQNKTLKSIDKTQSIIYNCLSKKNKQIENLKAENDSLKKDFTSKIKVKKEVLEENLEKNKSEYNEKIRNIDEEQEYLIEEIKVKDEEMKKKDQKVFDLNEKLSKSEKLIQELQKTLLEKDKSLVRSEEKNSRLEGKISWLSKKRPQKSDVENRLLKSEEDLEKIQDEKQKMEKVLEQRDDEVARLEEQKYFLENSLLERQLEVKKKEEQKMYLEKDVREQKDHFEKQLREMHEGIKILKSEKVTFQKEMKDVDKQMKTKSLKIKELEASLSKNDSSLKDEKNVKEKQALNIRQMNEAAKVTEEYKLDLENKIQELNSTIQNLQEENNTIILEDLKVIGKGREEVGELKNRVDELEAEIETLEEQKEAFTNNLAGKDQQQISLQIIVSEKDEVIFEKKNKSIGKLKKRSRN